MNDKILYCEDKVTDKLTSDKLFSFRAKVELLFLLDTYIDRFHDRSLKIYIQPS